MAKNPEDMTIKERKWLLHYISSGNAAEAARKAGYKAKSAVAFAVIGHENLIKLNVSEAMEEHGLTTKRFFDVLDDGLNADRVISAKVILKKGEDPDIDDKIQEATSKTDDFIEIPDHAVRHKYLETGLRLKKILVDRVALGGGGTGEEAIRVILDNPPVKNEQ